MNEVYRSSSTIHALFFPVFVHRILLHLGLEDFPTSEPVHIVTPIGTTFLRQRAAQLRVSSKRPRVEPSGVTPLPPNSIGDTSVKAFVNPAAATTAVPPPFTFDNSDIRRMLEIVLTIQAAHCQLLVDMLDEICALRAKLKHFRRSPLPPPFDDGF